MASHGEKLLQCDRFYVERVRDATAAGREYVRDVVRHPGSVVIVPLVDSDHICLIRNYRVATGKTLIELPAGTLEPGEPPLDTARRELLEETGFRAGTMRALTSFYAAPGLLDEYMHLFLASELTPGTPAREPNEQIENLVVSRAAAVRMVVDGEIQDAKSIAGVLFLNHIVPPSSCR